MKTLKMKVETDQLKVETDQMKVESEEMKAKTNLWRWPWGCLNTQVGYLHEPKD